MRLADYVFSFLREQGIRQTYMLSGGGIMYLVDALGRSGMPYTCCHHEQACSIAAQAYSMIHDFPCVCLVTTGPGGTNALTGLAAAYMDSTPVIFISGQVKRSDFASLRHVRQFGAQENDIVSMARPVAKYAVRVMDSLNIRTELEKALYLATHGRKGPVWLDIPLDVQCEEVEPEKLPAYLPPDEGTNDMSRPAQLAQEMLSQAKRPLFLLGHGFRTATNRDKLLDLQDRLQIPALTTWRCMGIYDDSDPLYFGSPGLQARRYANLILQAADLVIILGSRLDNMITAFNEPHFAYRAKKLIVDIDRAEMDKLSLTNLEKAEGHVEDFIDALCCLPNLQISDTRCWLGYCRTMREQYPLLSEKQAFQSKKADLYRVVDAVSQYCTSSDTIVVSSTSRCNTAGFLAFRYQKGQTAISSMAMGSMGFALPSAVGAAQASGGRVIVFEGDGSFQLNLQELQTIHHYHIDAKIFVFTNQGYAAIASMQDRNFEGFHVGCTEESGISMPALENIAAAYHIPYYCITKNDDIKDPVAMVFAESGPVICEICGDIRFDEIPKCISSIDKSGKRISAYLENPYPFLTEREIAENNRLLEDS